VQTVAGCRIESLEISQEGKAYAKVNVSSKGCTIGSYGTPLSPSISLAANDAPLSWAALRAGDFKIGYVGALMSADDAITSLKIMFNRTLTAAGYRLASDQPSGYSQGARTVTFEFTRDFEGDNAAQLEYMASLSGLEIGIQAKWLVGTSYVDITIPHAKVTNSVLSEGGASDDASVVTVQAEAYLSGADPICAVEVKDGVSSAYDAL